MKIDRKISRGVFTAVLCASLLCGCSTNVAEHTGTYFDQMKNVVSTAISSANAEKESSSVDENKLASPANFVVNADGTYSFDAVENAQYYYVYVYEDSASMDAAFQSEKIMDDGSASYSGSLADLGTFTYNTWNVRVVAYPDYDNSELKASAESRADYTVSGEVEYQEPTSNYMWNVITGTLEIKLSDMNYDSTAYPTNIEFVLTNTADSSDVVTIESGEVSASSVTVSTSDVKTDAVYSIALNFTWDENYVTNPTWSTESGEAETSSTDNLISGDFSYSSSIFKNFDFPHVKTGFDPVNGGDAGYWYNSSTTADSDANCYFTATPKTAENGALYSYDIEITSPSGSITASPKISPESSSTDIIFGQLDIFADGTFKMETEYQYISTNMMNAAVGYVPDVICEGTWSENADGTINLNYDHENAYEGEYDIVTELTGKAAEYAEANPDWKSSSNNQGGPGGAMPDAAEQAPAEQSDAAASEEAAPDQSSQG